MISRFTRHFLTAVLALVRLYQFHTPITCLTHFKILLASVTLLHPPHLNIRTGAFFGDGGAEEVYHALPIDVHDRPLATPHAKGSVIMSKLGNETAKWVRFCFSSQRILNVRP